MSSLSATAASPWPHRMAVMLAVATFPLIWVGGLVTTHDAGMAVPDWPSTYGYNLFLYPWQTWVYGPFDIFIEHGHRLLGATVGLLTIALVVCVWRCEVRRWVRWLAVAALAGVVLQGVLGGLRVELGARLLAQVHGCVGPAFFGLAAALAAVTSSLWRGAGRDRLSLPPDSLRLRTTALATSGMAYLQILLGSQVRHGVDGGAPALFRAAVGFHLVLALVLTLGVSLVTWKTWIGGGPAALRWPAALMFGLLVAQVALGAGAWVANYGFPAWARDSELGERWGWAGYTVARSGPAQVWCSTAHVANGSLLWATSVVLALRAFRLLGAAPRTATHRVELAEVAR